MSFQTDEENNGPQPFIRQESQSKHQSTQMRAAGSGGLGCALLGVVIVVVALLVGVALFLPPFSFGNRLFGTPFIQLNQQSNSTTQNGLTVSVDPASANSGFGVRLKLIKPEVFNGQAAPSSEDTAWLKSARAALPPTLTLLSPLYQIDSQGTASTVILSVAAPQGSDLTQVDLFQYDAQASRWQFVPVHPSPDGTAMTATIKAFSPLERVGLFLPRALVPIVNAVVDVGQGLQPKVAGLATVVHPSGLQPVASGALQGVLPAGVETGHGYGVMPVVRNFSNPSAVDVATVTTLLQNSGLRSVHVERLVEFASTRPYQGLAIDYRRVPAEQRDNFTAFITALAQKMHNANHALTVVVPFPTQNGGDFDTGAYDWRAIGAAADTVEIVLPLDPQAFADKGLVDSVLRWAVGEVNRAHLLVSMSALSVQETAGSFTAVGYADTLAPLGQIGIKPPGIITAGNPIEANLNGYRAVFAPLDSSGTPSIQYFAPDGTLVGTMWLTTGAVLAKRLQLVGAYNLAGVVAVDIAAPGVPTNVPDLLTAYKVNQQTTATQNALELHWSIEQNGKLVSTIVSLPGTALVLKPTDNIQIGAEIVGANSTLSAVSIRVAQATPTSPLADTPVPTVAQTAAQTTAPTTGPALAATAPPTAQAATATTPAAATTAAATVNASGG